MNNNSNKAQAVKYLRNGPVVPLQGGAPQQSYGMGSEEPGQEQRGRGREKETEEGVVEGREGMESEPAESRTGGGGGEGEKERGDVGRRRAHTRMEKKNYAPNPLVSHITQGKQSRQNHSSQRAAIKRLH